MPRTAMDSRSGHTSVAKARPRKCCRADHKHRRRGHMDAQCSIGIGHVASTPLFFGRSDRLSVEMRATAALPRMTPQSRCQECRTAAGVRDDGLPCGDLKHLQSCWGGGGRATGPEHRQRTTQAVSLVHSGQLSDNGCALRDLKYRPSNESVPRHQQEYVFATEASATGPRRKRTLTVIVRQPRGNRDLIDEDRGAERTNAVAI